jgi:hypothetical protein
MERAAVAVLGATGQQGSGLARRLAGAGYPVVVGSRDAARAAAAITAWNAPGSCTAATYADAVQLASVVLLAVPFHSVDALIADLAPRFVDGTLIVDVTVPLSFEGGSPSLTTVAEGSAAEHIRSKLPPSVRLAAAFKTLPAHVLHADGVPLDCDEFVCGDSAEARTGAAALVGSIDGLRAVDVGPLSRARAIEHLTLLAVTINRRHKRHDARFRVVGL